MDALTITIGIAILGAILFSVFLQLKKPVAGAPEKDWSKELAKLEKDIENERKEKNELSGKGKELYDRFKNLESEYKATVKERDSLQKAVTKYETTQEQHEREREIELEKLESAQLALKEERQRVIREEEEARERAEEERDRLWAEHETSVISSLTDLCKLPQFQFTSYSNTNLPDEFDGSLKPDFLIEFLGQYVIFDAKVSKAQSLQTYIDDAVKKTAEKIRKNKNIYPHVFLVVPTAAIGELKKLIHAKDEYYFYVVSREALAPILSSLKRIAAYELADSLDPQKRENIVNIIAELMTHISYRNAHELLLTKMGADALERAIQVDPEIALEVEQKKAEKKLAQLSPSELKRLAGSLTDQNIALQNLTSPKASVKKQYIDAAQSVMSQKLL